MTKIGCHVSIAEGIENAPKRATNLGAECFQIFSRSPHGGKVKEITPEIAKVFLSQCKKYKFKQNKDWIIHTPYYINLASTNNRIYYGSINSIRKELEVATLIKSPFVITHIGSSKDIAGKNVQKQVNKKVMEALAKIHSGYKGSAKLLLEIAAGSGNIIGDSFEEIGYFIKNCTKKKIDVGFCFDSCHSFAAGYDLRTPSKVKNVFSDINKLIGLDKLGCIHLNDSMTEFDSHKDRHEHIGDGKIGAKGLKQVALEAKKLNINLYLETKHDKIKEDIELTKSFLKK